MYNSILFYIKKSNDQKGMDYIFKQLWIFLKYTGVLFLAYGYEFIIL